MTAFDISSGVVGVSRSYTQYVRTSGVLYRIIRVKYHDGTLGDILHTKMETSF